MKNKKATISDIASALNISPSAVSKALNQHPRISKATREAVESMAKQLNYEPNYIAAALRKGKSHLIGIIVPAVDINFFSSVVKGVEAIVNEGGYSVIISQSDDSFEKEKRNVDALLNTQVDGIICSLAHTTSQYEHLDKILQKGTPLVLFDRTAEQKALSTVVIDDYQGAATATQHLIEQGCRNIVHLAGPQHVLPYQLRAAGFKETLQKNQLSFHRRQLVTSDLSQAGGRKAMELILANTGLPDGIFASSDQAAFGAMQVLKEKGHQIPEEVAIVGFSNETFGAFVNPTLSTVEQHGEKMGEIAAKLILDQCKPTKHKFVHRKIVLPTNLIIRESSRRFG